MKRDGSLWKAILEDVFDDFLLFFFEEQADMFDFDKGFVFLDKELEQLFPPVEETSAGVKFVDKLVKVFTKSGSEEWILVHVEVQGYNDSDFAKRMFTYFYRILDKYNKPVTCVTIFTDTQKSYRPQEFNYNFLGTKASFSYNTYKVIDQDAAELSKSNNPFAWVILTVLTVQQKGAVTEERLRELAIAVVKTLLQKQMPRQKIRAIMTFLRHYVHFDNLEIRAKFDNEINLITNNQATMGIEEFILQRAENKGMEKGMEKASYQKDLAFTKSLLTDTDFSAERIANLVGVSVSFVEEVKASLK